MATCYERLRKKSLSEQNQFKRLESYFNAVDEDKVDEYHNKHNRRLDKD